MNNEYLNCKVKCIKGDCLFYENKIYEIKDGIITDEKGDTNLTHYAQNKLKNINGFYEFIEYTDCKFELVEMLKDKVLKIHDNTPTIAETKNNRLYLLYDNGIMYTEDCGSDSINSYNDDLKSKCNSKFDIIAIYKYALPYGSLKDMFEKKNLKCIWRREKEIKEHTMEELQNKLGYEFKIVKDKSVK